MLIEDGKGSGKTAGVDTNNRVLTRAITISDQVDKVEDGDAYNINTGNISFTAAGTLLYLKNNEDRDIIVDALAVGMGAGTTSDSPEITIERNPTGGDLISDATAVAINVNRNFGSSKTLTADVYAGKSGGTSTGGTDAVYFYGGASSRLFATTNLVIPKGNSVAVTFDPKLSSGSMKAYAALVIFLAEA